MAIKNIVVKRKPLCLDVNSVVYTGDAFGSRGYVIRGKVEETDLSTKLLVHCFEAESSWAVGREDYIFLGDLGVPGHAYDDRPCSLFSSKLAAKANDGNYWEWLNKSRHREPDDYYFYYDSYHYG